MFLNFKQHRSQEGFALVIALSLMAFVLLLLLSISTLVSVESSLSSTNKAKLLAEQNARLGISIALGELQKYTGNDQSITARSDMDASLANTTSASGRWLGAYRNSTTTDYSQIPSVATAEILAESNHKGSQAKLTNWLISGNEGLGDTTALPTSLAFTPNDTVVNIIGATALSSHITINNQPARLLVGPQTVGNASVDYVAAPVQEISGANDAPTGGYAWWVGDEGSKARINLSMPSTFADVQHAFVTSPRAAIELMDAENASDSTTLDSLDMLALDSTGPSSAYNPSNSKLPRTNHLSDLSHLTTDSAAAAKIEQAIGFRYHDLSAYSTSLITDTYAGGFKQDLSALLATGATNPADTDHLFQIEPPVDGIPDPDADFDVPTWGQLRSFAQTTAGTALTPQIPTETQAGISPVLTYISLGFQYAAVGSDIHLAIFPIAVLWNPYTTPIKASRYEVGFQRRGSATSYLQLQEYDDSEETKNRNGMPWKVKETRSLNRAGGTKSSPAGAYFRFVIDAGEIPPGQSIIYSLNDAESGKIYKAESDGEPQNVLSKGLNPAGHTLLPSISQKSSANPEPEYRVAIKRSADSKYDSVTRTIPIVGAPYWPYSYIAKNNMVSDEVCAYLGEVVSTAPSGYDATEDDKRWYQSFTRAYPGTPPGYSSGSGLAQGPAPLSFVTAPVFAQTLQAQFSHSGLRWLAQSNPRAFMLFRQPKRSDQGGDGIDSGIPSYSANSAYSDVTQFIPGMNDDASSGYSLDAEASGETIQSTLFEFRADTQPLLSLGQLQHANLGHSNGHPAYAIGNSLADYRLKTRDTVFYHSNETGSIPTPKVQTYYDYSWNLNRSLFDRYFVSTVPNLGTGTASDTASSVIPATLPNARIQKKNDSYDAAELRDPELAATHLKIAGAFNINSTSEQAWRAILGGINQLAYDPVNGSASALKLQSALARFSRPTLAPNSESNTWQGYRQLDEEQIAELAKNIVAEIRNRGPFVSMADFVNRRLVDNALTADADERLKGTLQAAIDATTTGSRATNNETTLHLNDTPTYSGSSYDVDAMRGGTTSVAPYSSTSAFAPQFLTQADILSAIGSTLSARSDTFTIRSYGETTNPVTQQINGRAWCEAVIQRIPEYVSDADSLETPVSSLTSATNKAFGRKYKIIHFRWLSPEEI